MLMELKLIRTHTHKRTTSNQSSYTLHTHTNDRKNRTITISTYHCINAMTQTKSHAYQFLYYSVSIYAMLYANTRTIYHRAISYAFVPFGRI